MGTGECNPKAADFGGLFFASRRGASAVDVAPERPLASLRSLSGETDLSGQINQVIRDDIDVCFC
jgi:hypothetical protein